MRKFKDIDNGKPFDWGLTSEDYLLYRPGYPEDFFTLLRLAGIGASLPRDRIEEFDREHQKLLKNIAPDRFTIRHLIHFYIFEKKIKIKQEAAL